MSTTAVQKEVVSPILTKLTVTVAKDRLTNAFESRLVKFAKTVKINGFRPGKVPLARVRSDYGMAIQQEAVNDLLKDTLFECIDAEKIRAVGMPNVETVDMKEDALHYVALVDTYPEITLQAGNSLGFEVKEATLADADVDAMVEQLRSQRSTWDDKAGAAALKDKVVMDYAGTVDGEAFDGGTAKEQTLELGSGRMIPGFEDGIVGMKAGDSKDIDVAFPADYQAENLAGKAAKFAITVHKVQSATLPALDDAFFTQFNAKDEAQFKADIRTNMQRELKQNLMNVNKATAFDAILAAHSFEVPAVMLSEEIGRQRERMLAQFAQQFGGKLPNFNADMLPDNLFADKAKRAVSLGVLLAKVLEDNALTPDQAEVTTFIAELAESYEDKEEALTYFSNDKKQRAQIEAVVLENQIAQRIIDQANTTKVAINFNELRAANAALRDQ